MRHLAWAWTAVWAWCYLAGSVEAQPVGLGWCSPLCMCTTTMEKQAEHCFQSETILEMMGISKLHIRRLKTHKWNIEEKVWWCSDTCLCYSGNERRFRCTDENAVTEFVVENVGEGYFYDFREEEGTEEAATAEATTVIPEEEELQDLSVGADVEVVEQEEEEEEEEETDLTKRSEKRRGGGRRRKMRKNNRRRQEFAQIGENIEVVEQSSTPPEPEVLTEPHPIITTTEPEVETEAEELPQQEAIAASPAVTAFQPPVRHHSAAPHQSSFPTYTPPLTVMTAAPRQEAVQDRKKPSVVEVPKEKKTMASMVSQDLDELGNTVLEIQNDVVLNQRILLVTVALAGIAMLGVIILAVHGCSSSRRAQAEAARKREGANQNNHTTKFNQDGTSW